MYRLVTWQLPPCVVKSADGIALNAKAYHGLLKPVAELNPKAPAALCELIHKCLNFKAQQRPERMSELQGPLDHLVEELVRRPEDRLENMQW
jgi:hypothetical protein